MTPESLVTIYMPLGLAAGGVAMALVFGLMTGQFKRAAPQQQAAQPSVTPSQSTEQPAQSPQSEAMQDELRRLAAKYEQLDPSQRALDPLQRAGDEFLTALVKVKPVESAATERRDVS